MKARTNVSIDSDLLDAARGMEISLSCVLEEALKQNKRKGEEIRWKEENQESLAAYNKYIKKSGVFSDDMRTF
jgi:antitoxin CcdA